MHGMGIPVGNMDYLQADNEMRTFAAMTGGRAYFPRFQGELPEMFGDISGRYSQSVHPLLRAQPTRSSTALTAN